MSKKQVIDLELHNGVYEPTTLPIIAKPLVKKPTQGKKICIGTIDNNFIRTSVSVNQEMIAPLVFGVAAASLIVGMFAKLKRIE